MLQPECLMDQDGLPVFGQFNKPINDLGLSKFNYFNTMDKPASKLKRHFDYKQFQFISINCQDYLIGVAIADIRYLANAFVYVYQKQDNKLVDQGWIKPLSFGVLTSDSVINGDTRFNTSTSKINVAIKQGKWHLRLNTKQVNADITLAELNHSLPIAMCSPTGYNGWTYTQKHNALDVSGMLSINGQQQDLSTALAGYDFSAGYMRRETNWSWASINAISGENRIGLNLATGVNETGNSENVFWLNGTRHYLPQVKFEFKRHSSLLQNNSYPAWKIYSQKNSKNLAHVDLTFQPLNCRKEQINAWLIKSNFRQYMGHYQGIIRDNQGNETILDHVFGLSEDHFAKW